MKSNLLRELLSPRLYLDWIYRHPRWRKTWILFSQFNLIDSSYSVKSNILMTKDEYLWMVAHYFRIEQLFRIIQEWFGSNKGNDTWDINKEAFATPLQNSHQH